MYVCETQVFSSLQNRRLREEERIFLKEKERGLKKKKKPEANFTSHTTT